jgi:hypothetical protein
MTLPKNSKDLPALRSFLTTLRTQACASGDAFTGALKEMRDDLVKKLDSFINEIPQGDVPGDWCMEDKLQTLCSLLAASIAQASMSALEVAKLQTQMAGAVDTEISRRITAGELVAKDAHVTAVQNAVAEQTKAGAVVPKDTVTQLCADAKNLGIAEGEKKVRDEIAAEAATTKLIATRKDALQKAGKPLPEAEFERVLAGSEEEFNKVLAKFDTRLDGLKKAGVQLAGSPLLSKLFLPDEQYGVFEKTVSSIDALKTPPAEALAGSVDTGKAGNKPLVV